MKVERLNQLIAPVVQGAGYEFVGCIPMNQGGSTLLRIYIDKPGGVTVDDCAVVSRQVSALLDVEDPLEGSYHLEVSSPGIKRRLFNVEQCKKFIGTPVAIKLKIGEAGRRNFTGNLEQVMEDKILVQVEGVLKTFVFNEIEKINIDPDD